jgi:hypothetical protein
MRNITFSADERLIEAARERARGGGTTLNEEFRRWLAAYAAGGGEGTPGLAEAAGLYRDLDATRAGQRLLEDARAKAQASGTSLDAELRRWLLDYTAEERGARAMETIRRIQSYASTGGRKFTREEMNERR